MAGCPAESAEDTPGGSSGSTGDDSADDGVGDGADDGGTLGGTGMAAGSDTGDVPDPDGDTDTGDTGEVDDSDGGSDTTAGYELCDVMLPPPPACEAEAPPAVPPLASAARPSAASIGSLQIGGGPMHGGVSFECDLFAQDCPDGEKCMPWANDGGGVWNATRCTEVDADPASVGDPCTVQGSGVSGIDDCDHGSMCWGVDGETNMGECAEICGCSPDNPACETENTACAIVNGGAVAVCLPVCNPLDPDACVAGEACYPNGSTFACAPDASGGTGLQGDECMFVNGCAPGHVCVSAATVPDCDGVACCTAYCFSSSECSDGAECLNWYPPDGAPDECLGNVGLCGVQ